MSVCKCSPCGREFTGLSTFDRHQDVNYNRRPAVVCVDPAGLGMVQNRSGRWGFPLDESGRAWLESLRAAEADAAGEAGP